ncbi:extracellular solute-binding protein [Phyllobacterium chamaecytisi]|uniref:extracellular solute-binding protein n=1 Tax=Phyllobacterium chamaecytisi TaxID=2876082 RepID=UPI001CCC278B|nr:extracellular solute-binding protein [Phyllobacterium sp. KW56]MBZ9603063.1 extracellular solute-binding protein [Phyllobacterium sp. KW56]
MNAGALAVIGLAGMLATAETAFAGDQLTVVSWGGAYEKALGKVFFEPFTKATGIKLTEDEWSGEIAKIRAMVESKSVSWDVVDASGSGAWMMCAEGLLEVIDWKRLGLDRAKFGEAGKFDCGVPFQTNPTIVYYDKDKLPNGPKAIADLFDTKKFLGKRGLWKSYSPNLEWALIADGVPTKEVYKVLGTPEGVDRAFTKLDTIKKDAYKFLAFGGSPEPQADLTRYFPFGPGNQDAMPLLDPAVLTDLPNTPERDAIALQPDYLFKIEKGDELAQRFTAWLAQ